LQLSQLARDASGRLLVGGVATRRKTSADGLTFDARNVVVARLDPATHQLDPSWGEGGWAHCELDSAAELAGMEVGEGRNDVYVATPSEIVHFTPVGDSDSSSGFISDLRGIAVAADDRVFALLGAGAVFAYRPNLLPLTTFGTGGQLDVKSFDDEQVHSIVYMPRIDRVFVAGNFRRPGSTDHAMVVAIRSTDGTFDRRWASGSSKIEVDFLHAHTGYGRALAITGDSKLVLGADLAASATVDPDHYHAGLARFLLTNLGVPPPPGPPGTF
jgi:hypothetical protein